MVYHYEVYHQVFPPPPVAGVTWCGCAETWASVLEGCLWRRQGKVANYLSFSGMRFTSSLKCLHGTHRYKGTEDPAANLTLTSLPHSPLTINLQLVLIHPFSLWSSLAPTVTSAHFFGLISPTSLHLQKNREGKRGFSKVGCSLCELKSVASNIQY